tara:strand:+ start:165 stop:737 length:573 start_codon:yes stop_codon:yes gene_type:complete
MTKLCPRGKAAAKRKFKVYPSAYANAYASKICAGKIKDPSGVKRKDFKGKKPSSSKVASAAKRVRSAKIGGQMKVQKAGLGMLALGAASALGLRNMLKKKKNTVEAKTPQGQINPVTGEGMSDTDVKNANLTPTTQKMVSAVKNMKMFGASTGDIVNTPSATGSYIKQDIDGDESFVNQSAIDYYKGMLD